MQPRPRRRRFLLPLRPQRRLLARQRSRRPSIAEPNLPASRLDMDSPRKRFAEPVALEPPRSYVANSPTAEAPAAPALIAKNDTIPAPASVSQPAPAPVAPVQTPRSRAPTTANTAPAPARNQSSANVPAADHSVAPSIAKAPSVNTPPRKSAIAGSIYESDGSSLPSTSRAGTTSNSFVARGSNVTNSFRYTNGRPGNSRS